MLDCFDVRRQCYKTRLDLSRHLPARYSAFALSEHVSLGHQSIYTSCVCVCQKEKKRKERGARGGKSRPAATASAAFACPTSKAGVVRIERSGGQLHGAGSPSCELISLHGAPNRRRVERARFGATQFQAAARAVGRGAADKQARCFSAAAWRGVRGVNWQRGVRLLLVDRPQPTLWPVWTLFESGVRPCA